ncbi:MAG: type II secretion system F family protein [Methylobacteriaceae bacterium]|nr:type II secretion system F family protein [Methylobacteriaceae bacterium]
MSLAELAPIVLAALAAGGVAYVFLYPLLSGDARAEKRQKALVSTPDRAKQNVQTVNRRDQVAQSLRDLEQREKTRNKVTLEMRLRQAGLSWTNGRFYAVSALAGGGLALALFVVSGSVQLAGLGLFAGGLGLPRWILGWRKKKRINRYLEELPNAMDVIVRGIRSGLPLNDCMRIVASESQEPVRSEFRYIIEQQTLGISLPDAIQKLYERVPVAESNFFAIVISIQSKSGGNLSEALGNLSRVLRERKKMKGKIAAMSMEAKASAAIIGALPFIVALLTYVTSPSYIALLWQTPVGQFMLLVGAFWMSLGIMVMRKMINFDF